MRPNIQSGEHTARHDIGDNWPARAATYRLRERARKQRQLARRKQRKLKLATLH